MTQAVEQFKIAQKGLGNPECTKTYTATMGIPCSHMLKQKLVDGRPLQKHDFHWCWWLDSWNEEAIAEHVEDGNDSLTDILERIERQHENLLPHQRNVVELELSQLSHVTKHLPVFLSSF